MPNEAKNILIVEDERIVATDLHRTLRKYGYQVLGTAATADHALEITARELPDLVLMDVRIKGQLDGIDAARLLRHRYGVPVIFLTAHGDQETVERAKKAEPYGYLLKPINNEEVRSAVEIALHKHALDRQLQQRERWYATTLRSIGDAVIAVDLAGRITFINAEAEILTGCESADAIGKEARQVLQLSIAKNQTLDPPFEKALSERQRITLDEASIRNQTTKAMRLIADSASPVILNGELLGAVMVFRDITAQKQLQHQLELADRLASLGTMAAGVAHEIRNPLTIVLGQAALAIAELNENHAGLAREFSTLPPQAAASFERAEQALKQIHANAERISHIVGQLRAFGRPAAPTIRECSVTDALEWALRATQHEFQSRARDCIIRKRSGCHGGQLRVGTGVCESADQCRSGYRTGAPRAEFDLDFNTAGCARLGGRYHSGFWQGDFRGISQTRL